MIIILTYFTSLNYSLKIFGFQDKQEPYEVCILFFHPQSKRFNELLKFTDGHLCKGPPVDVVTFHFDCYDDYASHFRGILKIETEIRQSKKYIYPDSTNIVFLIEDKVSVDQAQQTPLQVGRYMFLSKDRTQFNIYG